MTRMMSRSWRNHSELLVLKRGKAKVGEME